METLKIVRSSQTGMTRRVETVYFDDYVFPQSYAALVLLNDMLRKLDVDYLDEYHLREKKIGFSREFLTEQKEIHGDLVCAYCGEPHLVIEMEGMIVSQRRKATIDHIVPLSKGVDFFDKRNLTVACGKCNSSKGSLTVDQFKTKLRNSLMYA